MRGPFPAGQAPPGSQRGPFPGGPPPGNFAGQPRPFGPGQGPLRPMGPPGKHTYKRGNTLQKRRPIPHSYSSPSSNFYISRTLYNR